MGGLVDKSGSSGATKTRYLSAGGRIMEEGGRPTGVFIENVPAGTAGSVHRKNMNGKDVYELFYNSQLIGKLINSEIMPNNYDGQLVIKLTLIDSSYGRWQVEMPVRSTHGRSFFGAMFNINPAYEIAIEPVFFVGTDRKTNAPKNVSYLNFFHIAESGESVKVEPWFTNDAPGHVPALVDTVYQGKPVKDDTARVNYLVQAHHQWSQSLFAEEKMRVQEFKQKQAAERAGSPQQQMGYQQQYPVAPQQTIQPQPPMGPVHQQYQPPVVATPPAPVYAPPQAFQPPMQYQQPLGTPPQQPPVPQQPFVPPAMPAQTSRPPGAQTPPPAAQPQMMRPPVITAPQVPQQGQADWGTGGDDSDLPF